MSQNQQIQLPAGVALMRIQGDRYAMTGDLVTLDAALEVTRRSGRLATVDDPTPTGVPGQMLVNVRLLPERQPYAEIVAAARPRERRTALWLTGAVVVLAGLAVWAMLLLISAVVSSPVALVLIGAAALAVLLRGGHGACKTVITIIHRH